MTNFFGINITYDKNNTDFDGEKFVASTLAAEQRDKIAQFMENEEDLKKKRELPAPLGFIKSVCPIVCAFTLLAITINWEADLSFMEGYRLSSGLYWAGLICLIAWVVLLCIGKKRRTSAENSADPARQIEMANTLLYDARQSLGVPEDAEYIDVLAEFYTIKNNEPKHRNAGMTSFINIETTAFAKEGNLCLVVFGNIWEIPLSSFRSVTLVKKRVSFPYWNKSEPFTSEKYSSYQIIREALGCYLTRYYRVEIIDPKGEFYLLIPEYDGETFMELTKLSANGD